MARPDPIRAVTPPAQDKCTHALDLRVYYEDTDAGGVVYYANYLKYMERGRTEWLRALGVDQSDVARECGRVFMVVAMEIKYLQPARLDDLLTVRTQVTRIGRASLNFAQQIYCNGELLTRGTVQVGCVDAITMRPAGMPPQVRTKLEVTIQE